MSRTIAASVVFALFLGVVPSSVAAWVEYGAFYATPAPHSQMYYQPMYAYASSPVMNQGPMQSQYIYNMQPQYTQQMYSYPQTYSYPHYNYYPQYNSYPPYSSYPNYSYPSYGSSYNMYGQNVPYSYGYPTGDTVPLIGGQLCEFPDYDGRALCGSNPNQWIYDPWTGSWY